MLRGQAVTDWMAQAHTTPCSRIPTCYLRLSWPHLSLGPLATRLSLASLAEANSDLPHACGPWCFTIPRFSTAAEAQEAGELLKDPSCAPGLMD